MKRAQNKKPVCLIQNSMELKFAPRVESKTLWYQQYSKGNFSFHHLMAHFNDFDDDCETVRFFNVVMAPLTNCQFVIVAVDLQPAMERTINFDVRLAWLLLPLLCACACAFPSSTFFGCTSNRHAKVYIARTKNASRKHT